MNVVRWSMIESGITTPFRIVSRVARIADALFTRVPWSKWLERGRVEGSQLHIAFAVMGDEVAQAEECPVVPVGRGQTMFRRGEVRNA